MILQFSRRQIIFFQIAFWLIVCTISLLPIDLYRHPPEYRLPPHHPIIPHNDDLHPPLNVWLEFALKNLAIIAIFYTNYFIFIPKFFLKRKVKTYFLISTALVFSVAFIPIFLDFVGHRFHFNLGPKEFHQFIIGLLASLLAIFLPLAFKLALQYTDAKRERAKAEISFLRSQINHHFLFNSLNNIYSLSIKGNPKAPDAIFSLSSIMRHMVNVGNSYKISLEKELDFIHHYIAIQKLRLSENTVLNYEVRGDASEKQISPMLLIPFVENCFKHGVSTTIPSSIDIVLEIGKNHIDLKTKNNIIEHLNNEHIKSGVGLENVKKRLEFEYPGHYIFSSEVKDGCYYSHLNIELI